MTKLDEALGLFPSVIKCGEQWSPRCQSVLDAAKAELASLRAHQSFSGCLRAGACHGVCQSTACTNYGRVAETQAAEPMRTGP
jgi:heterodisulfide reductase subunit C